MDIGCISTQMRLNNRLKHAGYYCDATSARIYEDDVLHNIIAMYEPPATTFALLKTQKHTMAKLQHHCSLIIADCSVDVAYRKNKSFCKFILCNYTCSQLITQLTTDDHIIDHYWSNHQISTQCLTRSVNVTWYSQIYRWTICILI